MLRCPWPMCESTHRLCQSAEVASRDGPSTTSCTVPKSPQEAGPMQHPTRIQTHRPHGTRARPDPSQRGQMCRDPQGAAPLVTWLAPHRRQCLEPSKCWYLAWRGSLARIADPESIGQVVSPAPPGQHKQAARMAPSGVNSDNERCLVCAGPLSLYFA